MATQNFAAAYNHWIGTVQVDPEQGLNASELRAWQQTEQAYKELRGVVRARY